MKKIYKVILTGLLPIALLAQTENWVYTYNGSENDDDFATSIIYGADGNIYAAGFSTGIGTDEDCTVISFTTVGDTNWTYTYNGHGDSTDGATFKILYGSDGNIYVPGYSMGNGTGYDFIIISLSTAGDTNWTYRYNGPANGDDIAYSIVYGEDDNIYAAGYSYGMGTALDFTVISLTIAGDTNWTYRYNGPANGDDIAYSIVYGEDGNIYAAGYSYNNNEDFIVISLATTGDTNWTYTYNGAADNGDRAYSLVYGYDNNLYAAGYCMGLNTEEDFCVISIDTNGIENWAYTYNGPGNDNDCANAIVYGEDGSIYAAGYSTGLNTDWDFMVINLTTTGDTNWIYNYNGPGNDIDGANAIVYGADDNIYAAGISEGTTSYGDCFVISFTTEGDTNWTYRFNGDGNSFDVVFSIIYGADGYVYVAGYSEGSGTGSDFTVISLGAVGVEENHISNPNPSFVNLEVFPNPFSEKTEITYCVGRSAKGVELKIYDITGRLIKNFVLPTAYSLVPTVVSWNGTDNSSKKLPSGVYFLKLDIDSEGKTFSETRKLLLLK